MCSSLSLLQINLMYWRNRKCKRPSGHHWPTVLKSGTQLYSIQFVCLFHCIYSSSLIPQKTYRGDLYLFFFFLCQYRMFFRIVLLNDFFCPSMISFTFVFAQHPKQLSTIKVSGVSSLRLETAEKWILNTLSNQSFVLGGNAIKLVLDDCIWV